MATAVNLSTPAGITIGSAVGSLGEWLRRITVRVDSSRHAHGSGVVWGRGGLIVTNAHVAAGQAHEVEFADGQRAQAWLVARDPRLDLAALAVATGDFHGGAVRSVRTLRPGEMVIAIGNPWDAGGAVSTGIVHRACGKGPWVVADIRLAPGNSGGPLADASGNVIGINSMIVDGLGWAVSSDAVDAFLSKARSLEVV